MNKEDRKQLEKIKAKRGEYESNYIGYEWWLISCLEKAWSERDKYDRALQSLTPGGSEFVHDPERCVDFVRQARDGEMRALKNSVRSRRTAAGYRAGVAERDKAYRSGVEAMLRIADEESWLCEPTDSAPSDALPQRVVEVRDLKDRAAGLPEEKP